MSIGHCLSCGTEYLLNEQLIVQKCDHCGMVVAVAVRGNLQVPSTRELEIIDKKIEKDSEFLRSLVKDI